MNSVYWLFTGVLVSCFGFLIRDPGLIFPNIEPYNDSETIVESQFHNFLFDLDIFPDPWIIEKNMKKEKYLKILENSEFPLSSEIETKIISEELREMYDSIEKELLDELLISIILVWDKNTIEKQVEQTLNNIYEFTSKLCKSYLINNNKCLEIIIVNDGGSMSQEAIFAMDKIIGDPLKIDDLGLYRVGIIKTNSPGRGLGGSLRLGSLAVHGMFCMAIGADSVIVDEKMISDMIEGSLERDPSHPLYGKLNILRKRIFIGLLKEVEKKQDDKNVYFDGLLNRIECACKKSVDNFVDMISSLPYKNGGIFFGPWKLMIHILFNIHDESKYFAYDFASVIDNQGIEVHYIELENEKIESDPNECITSLYDGVKHIWHNYLISAGHGFSLYNIHSLTDECY